MTIATLIPDGDSLDGAWGNPSRSQVNIFNQIDDGTTFAAADDTTTYLISTGGASPGQGEVTLQDLSVGAVTVNSVEHNMRIDQTPTGTPAGSIVPYWDLSGTENNGTSRTTTTTWTNYSEVIGRPGGGGWSDADVDALLFGFNGTNGDATHKVRITIGFADVDYTVAGGSLPLRLNPMRAHLVR